MSPSRTFQIRRPTTLTLAYQLSHRLNLIRVFDSDVFLKQFPFSAPERKTAFGRGPHTL